MDQIRFHSYYSFKDLIGFFIFFLALAIFVFYMPNKLGRMAAQQCELLNYDSAICWNSLDFICTRNVSAYLMPFSVKIKYIEGQSAGNQRNLNFLVDSSETTCATSYSDENFNYWLAGLIDGDGTLSVYKNDMQACEITLGEEDIKTLHKIKDKFHGSITKRSKVKAYRWRVYKKLYVTEVINAINGKLLTTSKHQQLIKICNKLNIEPNTNNQLSKENSWFSGFFDAEGYFSIRNKYTLTISVSQKNKEILEEIQTVFSVGNIYYDKSWDGYNYVVTDLQGIKQLLEYFEKFPLKTTKHIDFITMKRLVLFIERGYHLKDNPNNQKIDNLIKIFKNRKKK